MRAASLSDIPAHMIKLLIVDDSALMRRHLSQVFAAEGDFEIQFARNGREAVSLNTEYQPDVITLDINMPELDGMSALVQIMQQRPVPVVMVSSLTEKGALATLEALNLGAVDYIAKPGGTISLTLDQISLQLVQKVRIAAKSRVRKSTAPGSLVHKLRKERESLSQIVRKSAPRVSADSIVIIGTSTGGPRTLEDVLPLLPADFPCPILVAQHMPAAFTKSFADRMDTLCELTVVEAAVPTTIEAGHVYIGKGGADMVVSNRAGRMMVVPKPESADFLWHPSVELLGRSVLENYKGSQVAAVMLTGMGYDGADAFTTIKAKGGLTIAESERTSVVFGMPGELIKKGGASEVLDADRVADRLRRWAGI
jgi:two-component system chemotaxis response regulator CheB